MAVRMPPSRQATVIQRAHLPAFLVLLLLLQIQKPLRKALVLLLRVFQLLQVVLVLALLVLALLAARKLQNQVPSQVPAVQEAVQEVDLIQVLQEAHVHQIVPALQLLRRALVQVTPALRLLRPVLVHQGTPALQLLRRALVPQKAHILPLLVHQVVLKVQEPLHREHWEFRRHIPLGPLLPVNQNHLLEVVHHIQNILNIQSIQNRRVVQALLPQELALCLQVLPGQAAQLSSNPGTMNSLT